MEHLENDMDDLFQKAGELYPLKTTGSDWDAVAGKLLNEGPGEIHDLSGPTAVPTRRRTWLLLLLLIPMGLGIYYYSGNTHAGQPNALSAKPVSTSADQNKVKSVIPDNPSLPVVPSDNNKTSTADNFKGPSDKKIRPENGGINATPSAGNKRLAYAAGGKKLTTNNILNSQKQISSSEDGKTKSDSKSNNSSNNGSNETGAVIDNKSTGNSSSPGAETTPKAGAAVIPLVASAQNETAATTTKTDKTESSKKTSQDSTLANKKTGTTSKQSKGFYVGLIAGPDISSVDFQAIKHPGYSLGATLGYRFNKKLAVETGLIYDKKYYYSDGAHYKNQPPMVSIIDVDGNCDMFEIPLTLRYDFAFKKNGSFFAKGGFSSYLMRKQTYSGVSYNNNNGLEGSWGPKSNYPKENYFLSIFQLSGGYEFSISGKTKIQIEPYVKIPLQGIGTGSMPISSAGIYFGITHSFR